MIVWGGLGTNGAAIQAGARYNPSTDTWTEISTNGAPSARYGHGAIWTGSEMIVWGGSATAANLNTGGSYNPNTDTWTALTTNGTALGRDKHSTIWTGTEMFVWGGFSDLVTNYLNTGASYSTNSATWTATATLNAPTVRNSHTAIWTGDSMIIWGGFGNGNNPLPSGSIYSPGTQTWTAIPTNLSGRYQHSAIWTGSEMLIWGGNNATGPPTYATNDGARLNPVSLTWTPMTTNNAPPSRYAHTVVWTGTEMIVWGGQTSGPIGTGGRYNPTSNSWISTPTTTGAPQARFNHTAVWTGTEMIIFGGTGTQPVYKSGIGRFNPASNAWINVPPKCSLLTPTNNAIGVPNSSLTLTASASDNNGSVTNVQFFYNATNLLGSSTGPVFSVTWSNVPAGLYAVHARATDNQGVTTRSSTNILTVGTPTPPTVTLDSPTNLYSVPGPTNFPLTATATSSFGNVDSVEFFAGSTSLGTDTNPPYTLNSGPLAPGNYSFVAVASNAAGLVATSAPVVVFILTKPKILQPQFVGDSVQYSVQGIAGQTYIVDATTNLAKPNTIWTPIATNVAPANLFFFTDPDGTNYHRRFYRWRQ